VIERPSHVDVKVPFKIGESNDTVECDVAPMTVCHMLLGRPWQYDRSSLYCIEPINTPSSGRARR
jgi:hypothetical protein